jgi:nitroreductase
MAHDIFGLMAQRRSIKRFQAAPVEMDKMLQIIQAGALAPSAGNMQNWSFIIITDINSIRDMYTYTLNQEAFLSAMAAVVVCGDVEKAHMMYGMRGKRLYTIQNCAAAIENMLLAAQALNLGAVWVGAFDEDKISTTLDIPNNAHRPQAIILLGYPDYEPEGKEVKPLESLVYFNKWGNRVLKPHLIYYDWATEWKQQGQRMNSKLQHGMEKMPKPDVQDVKENLKQGVRKVIGPESSEALRQKIHDALNNLKKDEYKK